MTEKEVLERQLKEKALECLVLLRQVNENTNETSEYSVYVGRDLLTIELNVKHRTSV